MPWRDYGAHPYAPGALKERHERLMAAYGGFKVQTRIGVVRRYAQGKKVLDLGCVSHDFKVQSGGGGRWLHQHVVDVAAECVGADYDLVGVKEMNEAGYDAVHVDLMGDLTPILERGPFDVVIAGELIEHLSAPQQLLVVAEQVLKPGGQLVVTTPNPYAPHRVRAATRGVTWENADHVVYMFPSGMAELADRTGLVLTKYGTVGTPAPKPWHRELRDSWKLFRPALRARMRGKRNELSQERFQFPVSPYWLSLLDIATIYLRKRRLMQETSIYILTKPEPAPAA